MSSDTAMRLIALLCAAFVHLANAEVPWWRSGILYQVYPRSFADSNGDGSGDLRGVVDHVEYLRDLGIGIIWLSPIFDSPMKDNGYDVSDYHNVNPLYGNITDLEDLIAAVHKNGMKILLDYVPNHTSDLHPWFNASRYRQDGKSDYYVWVDPKGWNGSTPIPPNNWASVFGGSAWKWDENRKQYYLHQFGDYQPDLNFRSQLVIQEMQDIMTFWFDKGIDGLRVDAVPFVVEDEKLRDEPFYPGCYSNIPWYCMDHIYTRNLWPDNYDVLQVFDDYLKKYESTEPKYFFSEAYATLNETMRYYMNHTTSFNFQLITSIGMTSNATDLKKGIDDYMNILPDSAWPNWVMGNHDNSRIGSKLGAEMIDVMNMIILMLPGSPVTYNGEELGMVDTYIRPEHRIDTTYRDPERTPLQWDRSRNAGFSKADRTWLPINPNSYKVNIETESSNEGSHLNRYKRLAAKRKEFVESKDILTSTYGEWIFGFKRWTSKQEYYVVVNLDNEEQDVVLGDLFNSTKSYVVHAVSDHSRLNIGAKIDAKTKITMQPRSSVGFSFSSASNTAVAMSLVLAVTALWSFIFSKQ